MLAFDHVIVATGNLEGAARRLWDEHGLATVPGGRHPGHVGIRTPDGEIRL